MNLRYLILILSITSVVLLIWPILIKNENSELISRLGWLVLSLTMFGLAYDNAVGRKNND